MVWIVRDKDGKYLECFEKRDDVIRSVEITYSKIGVPKLILDDQYALEWENGIRADLITTMKGPNHL